MEYLWTVTYVTPHRQLRHESQMQIFGLEWFLKKRDIQFNLNLVKKLCFYHKKNLCYASLKCERSDSYE